MERSSDNLRHMPSARKHLAVVTMGVKLGDETRGYTRFRKLSEMLVEAGFDVDLITSSFQHWEKAQRDTDAACYRDLPYRVVFIDEPGYERNLDLKRIRSHRIAAGHIAEHFREHDDYDLIYAEIPPNDVARACAEAAERIGIPFVADINDLWPEAMRMAVNIPVISSIAFHPFARDAAAVYRGLTAAVGTSDEYAARPAADRSKGYPHITVYVGNDLPAFDEGVASFSADIVKPTDEVWAVYAGTLGASYDLRTLIAATATASRACPNLKLKILGDGPDRAELEQWGERCGAPVEFVGYLDHPHMAAYLSRCDITVNSLVAAAAQSIVTKIGDYLAAGLPMVNTGSSPEFRRKVETDGFGLNVPAEDVPALAEVLETLCRNSGMRKIMGTKARTIAETQFDQGTSYLQIVHLLKTLT